MPVYGLIIAIEDYPATTEMARKLERTNEAAVAFSQWLSQHKDVHPPGHEQFDSKRFYCCAEGIQIRTHGTTRQEIKAAILALIAAAADQCEELYVFMSGHGFCYPVHELTQEDIFVCADFTTRMAGGDACVKVQELMQLLTTRLGPGTQYYFFDACRTEIRFGDVIPASLGLAPQRSQLGNAGKAILFSVEQGLAARVDSMFSQHLVKGLNGHGRAKDWHNNQLYVKFDSLWRYVESQTQRRLSQHIGESEGLILRIEPIPQIQFSITVAGAGPGDEHEATVRGIL